MSSPSWSSSPTRRVLRRSGSGAGPFRYRLRFRLPAKTIELEDPYRFPPVLGELDVHLMAEGTHLRIYERLGAHPIEIDGVDGVAFAVWAPNAQRVSVVGDFNDWDGRRHPMRKRVEAGVWELFIPGLQGGELYKFEILGADGELLPLKADPLSLQRRSGRRAPPRSCMAAAQVDWADSRG